MTKKKYMNLTKWNYLLANCYVARTCLKALASVSHVNTWWVPAQHHVCTEEAFDWMLKESHWQLKVPFAFDFSHSFLPYDILKLLFFSLNLVCRWIWIKHLCCFAVPDWMLSSLDVGRLCPWVAECRPSWECFDAIWHLQWFSSASIGCAETTVPLWWDWGWGA